MSSAGKFTCRYTQLHEQQKTAQDGPAFQWTLARWTAYEVHRMGTSSLPDTIRTILDQAGGLGLRGAFTYIGAQRFTYRCAEPVGEYRSGRMSELKTEGGQGFVDYEVGLQCRVNGKPGRAWTLIIAYEPDDTYTVWLIEAHAMRQPASMVLACQRDVYSHTLQGVIEHTDDSAINAHNGGFIPLS